MNKKDYVSLEVAKLLKEKGYDKDCNTFIVEECWGFNKGELRCVDKDRELCSCPTLYEAAKWLRSKGIFIEIIPHYSRKYDVIEYEYRIYTYIYLLEKNGKRIKSKEYYEKFEQCLNDAILEALKLI